MNASPPPRDPSDDADEQYRRASERDSSRPSEATRRAVLSHAARLAAERARGETRRRGVSWVDLTRHWRPVIGTLAAAGLAAVLIAPQLLGPRAPPASGSAPATAAPQAHLAAPPPDAQSARSEYAPAAPVAKVARSPIAAAPALAAAPAPPAAAATNDAAMSRAAAGARQAPVPVNAPVEESTASVQVSGARAVAPPAAVARMQANTLPATVTVAADPNALRQAAASGDLKALAAQLSSGSDIDARDAEGRTPLMLAALNGQEDAVSFLLAHGADPRAADAHGMTPLQAAIAADQRGIIATLRRYGAR